MKDGGRIVGLSAAKRRGRRLVFEGMPIEVQV
jgi:hypothetical protein